MDIEIKRLTTELIDDYLNFFDITPHSTGKSEHRCYCICWASTKTDLEACSTAIKRRFLAEEYIKNNFLQGYLAYSDGKVIGWCNANTKSDCFVSLSWTMFMSEIRKEEDKVKAILCFTIAPEYRRKGVAKLLLERVLEDAKKDGFAYVEAYPNKEFIDIEQDFMGPYALYEKLGFEKQYSTSNKIVMRKDLTLN